MTIDLSKTVTRDEEADHLLRLYGDDAAQVMARLEQQLAILAARAQTLLSLAGLTVTVTGFSGASIARTGRLAAGLAIAGLVTVLVAAALTMRGILRVRWTTSLPPCSLRDAVLAVLELRDAKTRAYSQALGLLVVGLTLYVASVTFLLFEATPR